MSKAAENMILKYQLKELTATDPYEKGRYRGYWEGIRDCLQIECRTTRTPEWLATALNQEAVTT